MGWGGGWCAFNCTIGTHRVTRFERVFQSEAVHHVLFVPLREPKRQLCLPKGRLSELVTKQISLGNFVVHASSFFRFLKIQHECESQDHEFDFERAIERVDGGRVADLELE